MQTKKRQLFDMDECLKERKSHSYKHFEPREEHTIATPLRIAGVGELSKFRTRVVLNERISGKPLDKALQRAMSLLDKRAK